MLSPPQSPHVPPPPPPPYSDINAGVMLFMTDFGKGTVQATAIKSTSGGPTPEHYTVQWIESVNSSQASRDAHFNTVVKSQYDSRWKTWMSNFSCDDQYRIIAAVNTEYAKANSS